MDDQNRNLILATVLSFAVILVWFVLFPRPSRPRSQRLPSSSWLRKVSVSPRRTGRP